MKHKKPETNSLVGHLTELRRHIILSLVLFLVVSFAAFHFAEILVEDMISKSQHTSFVYLSPAELFSTYLKIALVAGLVVSLPFLLNRLWVFIKPGLYPKEIQVLRLALLLGFILFVAGLTFAYLVVLPISLDFLASFQIEKVQATISFASYFDYVMKMVFAFALVFEMPILVVILVALGVVNTTFLKKNRKYVFLLVLVVAAVVTPPDIVSQVLLTVPMMILFELGIILSRWLEKKKIKRENRERE